MTTRWRPRNSSRQAIQRFTCESRTMLRSALCSTPRLPINVPRAATATMSPNGVTRLRHGIPDPRWPSQSPPLKVLRACHTVAMSNVGVTLVTRNYAYVQPLANGDVRADGFDLNLVRTWDALPRVAANSADVHGGEASFGRYMLGVAAGDRSLVGLPIFLMRGFRQRCYFVRQDSQLRSVADLAGKRVGINEWPATGNTWARALLRDQGVDIWSVRWLVGQVSDGYKPVPG